MGQRTSSSDLGWTRCWSHQQRV